MEKSAVRDATYNSWSLNVFLSNRLYCSYKMSPNVKAKPHETENKRFVKHGWEKEMLDAVSGQVQRKPVTYTFRKSNFFWLQLFSNPRVTFLETFLDFQ